MQLKLLKQQWGDISLENKVSRVSLPLLAIAVVIAVISMANEEPVVIVQPPNMSEQAQIAKNEADSSYKQSYGLFVASMMGNVHPGNADFLLTALESMIHPSVYHEVKEEVMSQVTDLKSEDIAITFAARDVDYWSDTDRVVVYGNREMSGRGTDTVMERVTYELTVGIDNYRPMITHINIYEGAPERRR